MWAVRRVIRRHSGLMALLCVPCYCMQSRWEWTLPVFGELVYGCFQMQRHWSMPYFTRLLPAFVVLFHRISYFVPVWYISRTSIDFRRILYRLSGVNLQLDPVVEHTANFYSLVTFLTFSLFLIFIFKVLCTLYVIIFWRRQMIVVHAQRMTLDFQEITPDVVVIAVNIVALRNQQQIWTLAHFIVMTVGNLV